MSWTLDSITIHPPDDGFTISSESVFAVQLPLDATWETINWFGSRADRISLSFILDEDANSNNGLSTIKGDQMNGNIVTLSDDQSNSWDVYVVSFRAVRKQALNHTYPVYNCSAELLVT